MYNKKLLSQVDIRHSKPHSTLSYNSYVSIKHKYLFMSVPKAACTKVKWSLHQLEGYSPPDQLSLLHSRPEDGQPFVRSLKDFNREEALDILTSPDWFRFCFVRNPYDRILSAYRSKILSGDPQYGNLRDKIRRLYRYPTTDSGERIGGVTFHDFVRYVHRMPDRNRDYHWRSQFNITLCDAIDYSYIGRFENFEEDFTELLRKFDAPEELITAVPERLNKTPPLPHPAVYDRDIAKLVYEMYREDFAVFDYVRDSWLISD
jgi:hypothetical protein